MRTDEELKKLAKDYIAGHIFSNREIRDGDARIARQVFMVLTLMSPAQMDAFIEKKPAFFFEYRHKALPMAINGYPIFTSLDYLDQEEFVKFQAYVLKVQEALDAV